MQYTSIITCMSQLRRSVPFLKDFTQSSNKHLLLFKSLHYFFRQKPIFNAIIMGVIMINALAIGLETMDSLKNAHGKLFQIVDELFLSVYTVEFILKVYAEPRGYWKSSYNRFDFLILFISYIQAILDTINVGDNVLKPLRLLRGKEKYFIQSVNFIYIRHG